MAVDVILGLQWGDEGKGKIVDVLADKYDMVCRFQGGPNAGHTIWIGDQKFVLHTIPSGVFQPGIKNLIGNGVVIDPITLVKEIVGLEERGIDLSMNLFVSNKAHLILPTHRLIDAASEAAKGKEKIGSTLRGIGPTYMDKTGRNGLRFGDIHSEELKSRYEKLKAKHLGLLKQLPKIEFDLEAEEQKWFESLERLRQLKHVDGEYFVNERLSQGKKILAEGAQGSMLDIDFGTYPFVTSSNTIASGVCNGLGIAPSKIERVIGITKAYCTRVGSGPFPTELFDQDGENLRAAGHEFGATTGRPRRCGWIDLPQLKYTIMINGVTDLALTKIDVLNSMSVIKAATHYQMNGRQTDQLPYDLLSFDIQPLYEEFTGWCMGLEGVKNYDEFPALCKQYIESLEAYLNVPVSFVSIGPERYDLVVR